LLWLQTAKQLTEPNPKHFQELH